MSFLLTSKLSSLPMFSETFSKVLKAALVFTARNSASWGFNWNWYTQLHLSPNCSQSIKKLYHSWTLKILLLIALLLIQFRITCRVLVG